MYLEIGGLGWVSWGPRDNMDDLQGSVKRLASNETPVSEDGSFGMNIWSRSHRNAGNVPVLQSGEKKGGNFEFMHDDCCNCAFVRDYIHEKDREHRDERCPILGEHLQDLDH